MLALVMPQSARWQRRQHSSRTTAKASQKAHTDRAFAPPHKFDDCSQRVRGCYDVQFKSESATNRAHGGKLWSRRACPAAGTHAAM